MTDLTITVDSDEYVLRPEGGDVRVGRRVGGDVTWLESVDAGLLSGPAREALERGDTSDAALQTAVRGIAQAEEERGG
jgi:hypothetical protein